MSVNGDGTPVFKNQKKSTLAIYSFIAILLIGDLDYITGYQLSIIIFYLVPIGFAAIYVGPVLAQALAVLSIAVSICSDFWAGIPAPQVPVMLANAIIALIGFALAIILLDTLKRSLLRRP